MFLADNILTPIEGSSSSLALNLNALRSAVTSSRDAMGSAHNTFETCEECGPPRGLSGPQIARKAAGRRTSLCLTVNCYQRFRDLNLSSMRRFVPACVKAWKDAQIIPSTAVQEKMVGVAPCNFVLVKRRLR